MNEGTQYYSLLATPSERTSHPGPSRAAIERVVDFDDVLDAPNLSSHYSICCTVQRKSSVYGHDISSTRGS